MTLRLVAGSLLFALTIAGCSTEAPDVKRTVLPNGLILLTRPVTSNNIVSFVVALRMGSLYETDETAGLTTLTQDTIRKGTTTRTSEQIALELETMGTRLGTSADREYGTIEIQSTEEKLYQSTAILYDILLNATFPEDAVELQKTLQTQALLARYDQPLYKAVDLMAEAHYGDHPFHKPAMGYAETIATITRDDVVSLYHAVYTPSNMVISVVGNFDEAQLIADVTEHLGALPAGTPLKPVVAAPPAPLTSPEEQTEYRSTAASWFALGWTAPPLDDPDYYAMEVLDAITGGSMNSRLFIAIREQRGLAYQVASFYNARRAAGIYAAYIGTKPESYEESKSVLLDEVYRMAKEPVTTEEITLAKNYLTGMQIMSQESNSGQANLYAHYEIIGIGYEFMDAYRKNIENVTADDVMRVGTRYLTDGYALGAVIAEP